MFYAVLEPPPQYLHPYHGAMIERVLMQGMRSPAHGR